MRISRVVLTIAFVASVAITPALALGDGKPVAGCPHGPGWVLGTVQSFGIDPATASGIPSLDGNGDGWTCGRLQPLGNGFEGLAFRDNNVRN